jgi:hypothetical protein
VEVDWEFRGESQQTTVKLWSPPRHLAEVTVPILANYSRSPAGDEVEFALLDLWVLSLFEYQRSGQTRSYRFLRWIGWDTGVGELVEVPAEPLGRQLGEGAGT